MEISPALTCPDCQAALPTERSETPWCECGWTTYVDKDRTFLPFEKARKVMARDEARARRLVAIDARLLASLDQPEHTLSWRLYEFLTLALCLPIYLARLAFWGLTLAALVALLWYRLWPFMVVIVAAALGVLLINALAVKPIPELPGIWLDRNSAPRLFALIDGLAQQLGAPAPDRVRVTLNAEAKVQQRARAGFGRRPAPELHIGLLTFRTLTLSQFKTVVAHELAHLRARDTWHALVTSAALENLQAGAETLAGFARIAPDLGCFLGGLLLIIVVVVRWTVELYQAALVGLYCRASRRQEYLADRVAAQLFGGAVVMKAILTLQAVAIRWRSYLPYLQQAHESGLRGNDFYEQFAKHWDELLPRVRERFFAEAMATPESAYDLHPSYKDRARALRALTGGDAAPPDAGLAENLVPAAQIGRQLSREML